MRTLATGDVAASADDVAADVWLTAARRIGSFEGDEQAFAGWLFGIGRHHVMNARRRTTRRATTPSDPDADDRTWGVVDDVALEVVAVDVAGLDTATTAAALGISATAVRVARHRALGRLRRHLAEG